MLPVVENAQYTPESTVIIRVDFNEPIDEKRLRDDFRIKVSVETIDFVRATGAKVLLISHTDTERSLETLVPILERYFPVRWAGATLVAVQESLANASSGEVFIMENLRTFSGEEENDLSFSEQLAALGTHYINEAFSVSHRRHASIVSLPKLLPAVAGKHFIREVSELSRAFLPERPFLFITGGAKFETKEPLISGYLEKADTVFVGGALANDFLRAQGLEVGRSKVSDISVPVELLNHSHLMLPHDVLVEGKDHGVQKNISQVIATERIVDIGAETLLSLGEKIKEARLIVWNGPLGDYEHGYGTQSLKLAEMISESGAFSIVGGGDTLALLREGGVDLSSFGFVSTGGGAMLHFLAEGSLPGIDALQR